MQHVRTKKLSDEIMERIESMLIDGTFLSGQKMPSERELALKFAVSRPSVREAIQKLEAKGLVERKQGGGTFVKRRMNTLVTDPLMALLTTRPETQFDLLEFRHALEGMAAYYAALRGQQSDYDALQDALSNLPSAAQQSDHSREAEALVEFYLTMAVAAHNVVLLHVMRSFQALLKDNIHRNLVFLSAYPDAQCMINSQRKNIVQAIIKRDPKLARDASNEHLAYIEKTLLDINRQDMRMQRALRRIEVKE